VDYELTPLGRSLRPPLRAINDWAEKHAADIMSARAAHDAANTA